MENNEEAVKEFLKQSNYIEGVYDEESLNQAMIAWKYLIGEKEMTMHVMLRTHKILMLHQPGLYPDEKGYFRTVPVFIGGKQAMNAKMIRPLLSTLCMNMQFHPENWKAHHIQYEKIHPFVDGNGRTGRMFLNWERIKAGLPVEIIYEADRQDYYKWFK